MPELRQYRSCAHWTTSRRGIVEAESIPRTINFSVPPEFQGEPGLWTPEHLLVAALSTCYVATARALAEASKLDMLALEVTVEGTLEKEEGGLCFTQMRLRPVLTIVREADRERAVRLLEKAERVCLIGRSLKARLSLEPTVTEARGALI